MTLTNLSLEEHIAIIGANMALARYAWLYFHDRMRSSKSASSSRQYIISTKRAHLDNTVGGLGRRASFDSDLPLENSKIRKTTDLQIRREPRSVWPGNNQAAAKLSSDQADRDTELYMGA